MLNKKLLAALAVVVVVIASVGAYYYLQSTAPVTKISLKFGTPVKTSSEWVPIYFAAEKGMWAQNALEVQVVSFTGDATLTQAFQSGEVQIAVTNALLPIRARDRGIPLQIVAQLTAVNDFVLIVKKDSPIKAPKDLAGKKVGVTTLAGLLDVQVQDLALTLGSQITSVPLGGLDNQVTALTKGEIDGFAWSWDGGYLAQEKGLGQILLFFADYYPRWKVNQVITAHENLIKNNPEAVRRVIKTIQDTVKFMNANVDETTKFAVTYLGLSADLAKQAWQKQGFSVDGKISLDGVKFAAELLVRTKQVDKPPVVDDVVNKQFATAA